MRKRNQQVGTYEAKTFLPKLLEKVVKGESITITKHGSPIAMLVPFSRGDKPAPQQAINELLAFGRKRLPRGQSIRSMMNEGRKA